LVGIRVASVCLIGAFGDGIAGGNCIVEGGGYGGEIVRVVCAAGVLGVFSESTSAVEALVNCVFYDDSYVRSSRWGERTSRSCVGA
jgi:hypothetical protein